MQSLRRAILPSLHKRTGSTLFKLPRYSYSQAATATVQEPKSSQHSVGQPRANEEKIMALVDEISHLSLLEASALVDALKLRLNIKDVVSAQPMMAAPQQASAPVAAEAQEEKKEQTEFTITLESFDAAAKAKVIREMKAILPGSNLVEAKKFVESAPKKIMENISKEQVEKIKTALEAVGAKVKVE